MTAEPHTQRTPTGHLVGWWIIAILPGVLFAPLGILAAALAAWQCRRFRLAFAVVAVLWAVVTLFYYPWGSSGVGSSGHS